MDHLDLSRNSQKELDIIWSGHQGRAENPLPLLESTVNADFLNYIEDNLGLPAALTFYAVDQELAYIRQKLSKLRINSEGQIVPMGTIESGKVINVF